MGMGYPPPHLTRESGGVVSSPSGVQGGSKSLDYSDIVKCTSHHSGTHGDDIDYIMLVYD